MNDTLRNLSDGDQRNLATALRSGRVAPPFTPLAIRRFVVSTVATNLAAELNDLYAQGLTPSHIALMLELVAADRSQRPDADEIIHLVTTGPEVGATANRDTGIVVRELFASAEQAVLVAGYAVYQGRRVFQALAERMAQRPKLGVRLFLDVQRRRGDTASASEIVNAFGDKFRREDWPVGGRLPDLFYFPPSLEEDTQLRASLHAKCVVVDARTVFVGSANFTEAAQQRNIEIGLRIESPSLAQRIVTHFDAMVSEGLLKPVF